MGSTFKVLFYLKRDKRKVNGSIPLFCRITIDGKEARFSMKCDVQPKFWDIKANKALGRTIEATKINLLLDNTKASIIKIYRNETTMLLPRKCVMSFWGQKSGSKPF